MNTITTFSDKCINLENPNIDDISIYDIAHHLAIINRYSGATAVPCSVAQHCVIVAENCSEKLQFTGLMHDCSEAYLGDVISPLKNLLQEYRNLEEIWMNILAEKFGFIYPIPKEVNEIDILVRKYERSISIGNCLKYDSWNWNVAERNFLMKYEKLRVK